MAFPSAGVARATVDVQQRRAFHEAVAAQQPIRRIGAATLCGAAVSANEKLRFHESATSPAQRSAPCS